MIDVYLNLKDGSDETEGAGFFSSRGVQCHCKKDIFYFMLVCINDNFFISTKQKHPPSVIANPSPFLNSWKMFETLHF